MKKQYRIIEIIYTVFLFFFLALSAANMFIFNSSYDLFLKIEVVLHIMSMIKFLLDISMHILFLTLFRYIQLKSKYISTTIKWWVYYLVLLSFNHSLWTLFLNLSYYINIQSQLFKMILVMLAFVVVPIKDYLTALSLSCLFYYQGLKQQN